MLGSHHKPQWLDAMAAAPRVQRRAEPVERVDADVLAARIGVKAEKVLTKSDGKAPWRRALRGGR